MKNIVPKKHFDIISEFCVEEMDHKEDKHIFCTISCLLELICNNLNSYEKVKIT